MDIKHSSSKACCQDKYDRERGKKLNKKKKSIVKIHR